MTEIKDVPKSYKATAVSDAELDMAKNLINAMNVPFDPEAYEDEYQQKLRQLIEDKIEGKEITTPDEQVDNITNLMDALSASVERLSA